MDSLERFVSAQARDYGTALAEIRSGHKRSHWMWYIFPQLQGLGMSSTAQYYGIHGIEEAKRFIAHPGLGRNLREISNALLALDTNDPAAVMGWPDNLKLCSCMTLFEAAAPGGRAAFSIHFSHSTPFPRRPFISQKKIPRQPLISACHL